MNIELDYLPISAAAKSLGLTPRVLRYVLKRERLPVVKMGHRTIVVSRDVIQTLVARRAANGNGGSA